MKKHESQDRQVDELKKVLQWGKDRPLAIVALAVMCVAAADTFYELLTWIRKGRSGVPGEAPSIDEWLSLYRSHRRLRDACPLFEDVTNSEVWGESERLGRLTPGERAAKIQELSETELAGLGDSMVAVRQMVREIMRAAIADDDLRIEAPDIGNPFANTPLRFLMFVWLPCWLEYQTEPVHLLQRARAGDIEALEDLLRVDKSVLFEPRISRLVHAEGQAGDSARWRRICAGVSGRPIGNLTRKKVKVRMAAFASQLTKRAKFPLSEPEIRSLFDLVAEARGSGIDTDLPKAPEALVKSLQREGGRWVSRGRTDKSR